MNGNFKKIFIPALSLFLICLVSALLLALTNELTADKIAESAKAEEVAQRAVVFPGASYAEEENHTRVLGEDGSTLGYIFVTEGKGYGGVITVMTGIDVSGKITGVKVLSHSETSSYGGKAIKNEFEKEFIGKEAAQFAKGKNFDGWTGATRTTNGVIQAVNAACELFAGMKGGK